MNDALLLVTVIHKVANHLIRFIRRYTHLEISLELELPIMSYI